MSKSKYEAESIEVVFPELITMKQVSLEWIDVEERLPELDEEVLVRAKHTRYNFPDVMYVCKRGVDARYTDGNGFLRLWDYRDYAITHWWYIPKVN